MSALRGHCVAKKWRLPKYLFFSQQTKVAHHIRFAGGILHEAGTSQTDIFGKSSRLSDCHLRRFSSASHWGRGEIHFVIHFIKELNMETSKAPVFSVADYTLRVHVDPPMFGRHDHINGRRFREPVDVEFSGVHIETGRKKS